MLARQIASFSQLPRIVCKSRSLYVLAPLMIDPYPSKKMSGKTFTVRLVVPRGMYTQLAHCMQITIPIRACTSHDRSQSIKEDVRETQHLQ